MPFGLLVISLGFSMARTVPGGKDETPSVAKSVEDFLRDWTRGQFNEPPVVGGPHLQDPNADMMDDFKDRSDDHKHLKSEREHLISRGIILPVHKHASVEEVYHSEELPRIKEAYEAGDQGVISEALQDPLELKAKDLKFHELLAADVYFSFLTRQRLHHFLIQFLQPFHPGLLSTLWQ